MKQFWIALQFLTRLPAPRQANVSAEDFGQSMLYYPLVGLIIGMGLWLAAGLTQGTDANLAAAILLALWVGVTGALHLDGLADAVDALVGGHGDRVRTLAIMKDPYCGPMGVAAIIVVLLLKFAALASLLSHGSWAAVMLAPVIGRSAVVALFCWTPYARQQGLGSPLTEHLPRALVPWVLGASVLVTLLFGGWRGFFALLVVTLVFYLIRDQLLKRLGGTTGDTAGATIELIETVALILLAWQGTVQA